ncbi:flavoprotein-like protein [Boletus reticuloceps]|uniref:Flavoprotein-like protein n=1 Tax=Boletus reticuloceps TaxID=495285 RepID=A0A8I3AC53_9AGAM|nr:flavoprotein-like protein [Boletus reticuloceps]
MSSPRIAIIIYSMYGHIAKLAESVKEGVIAAGGSAKIYQIPETLPDEILAKMHAPPKPDYPVISVDQLAEFDGFLFGIPTRYGNFPAQWKVSLVAGARRRHVVAGDLITPRQAFWDATGQLWATGALAGKFAAVFVSTGTPGGGQEATIMNSLSTLVHHGIVYVPLGYSRTFTQLSTLTEIHGGASLLFFLPSFFLYRGLI